MCELERRRRNILNIPDLLQRPYKRRRVLTCLLIFISMPFESDVLGSNDFIIGF